MRSFSPLRWAASAFLAFTLVASARAEAPHAAYGSSFKRDAAAASSAQPLVTSGDAVRRWNTVALNATGLDHTPVAPGETRTFGEQIGPGRAARAMAIIHIAIFDAYNGVQRRYSSFTGVRSPKKGYSIDAAVAQAAHDTLVVLFPSQRATFDAQLAADLLRVRAKKPRQRGVIFGAQIAAAILSSRVGDGSERAELLVDVEHLTSSDPGHWRQDPVSLIPLALGAKWGECIPFVLQNASQFRTPPPPDMTSPEYAAAYNEVKALGGDGVITPTSRTEEQTFVGIFWAYDGTPSLCAPPRLYNQIALQIAAQTRLDTYRLARLLALINVAMADTGMAAWESKFHYDLWRPVHGIRESDAGTGPSGVGDGNDATVGDISFMPLGAPASNLVGPNFTPPFPAYPSGHAAFGGALFQVLRRFYGTDGIGFTFVSDEYNGSTRANDGTVRPYLPRSFSTLSQAEEENGQSRIYLGIHWSFDKTSGITQGRQVADYVYDRIFTPVRR